MPTTFHQMNRNRKNTFTTPRDSHAAYKSYLKKVRHAESKKHSKVISQARKNRGHFWGYDALPRYEPDRCLNDDGELFRIYNHDVKQDPRQTRNQRLCNRELLQELGHLPYGM